MGENKRARGVAALLILLALASFAVAAITITNITEWTVRARYPPIVKVQGPDAINTEYIYTNIGTGTGSDGSNRTLITITGFRGDPTKYDQILLICNNDSKKYDVALSYNGTLKYPGNWTYVSYIKFWIAGQGPLTVTGTGASGSAATTILPKSCAAVTVEVLVKANLPDDHLGKDILTIQIDVEAKPIP